MVERHLAKVDVAGPTPVSRSIKCDSVQLNRFFFIQKQVIKKHSVKVLESSLFRLSKYYGIEIKLPLEQGQRKGCESNKENRKT